MISFRSSRRSATLGTMSVLLFNLALTPGVADAQWKRPLQLLACGGAVPIGLELGKRFAEIEARRKNLSPEEAEKHKKAFQVGMALALCGGGAIIAGTTYSKLSKRGKDAREREIKAALEDAAPTSRNYADPETPSLQGVITAQPAVVDDDQECRIVQDQLGADEALMKYCKGSDGKWKAKRT
jgi:hypothetical protein